MKKYLKHTSVAALLNRRNVDTDQIIAKQFLKKVERTGFGQHLFHDWRFHDDGSINSEFELNNPKFEGAKILVTGDNFGCGSSREHAPWAIDDFGFNTIISSSFADIFYNNCFKNGILPLTLTTEKIDLLFKKSLQENLVLEVNLEELHISSADGQFQSIFEIDDFRRSCLLGGLDDIGLTLQHTNKIRNFEQNYLKQFPWLQ